MNINDLIEQLKWISSINFAIEDLLSADLNCLSEWQDEISDWFRADAGLKEIIVQLEAHSGPPEVENE